MELVLGLAALATAVSGVSGAGHYEETPEVSETNHSVVQTMKDDVPERELGEGIDLPNPHIGDFVDTGKIGIGDWIEKPSKLILSESENNGTLETANSIKNLNSSYENFLENLPATQTGIIRGKIGTEFDVDWFKFTVYGKANVQFSLSRPSGSNYKVMELRKKVEQTNPHLTDLLTEVVSFSGSGTTYNANLYPGVYYVQVASPTSYHSNTNYTLTTKINYDKKDESISDLMDMGAKAAIWLNDYDPYGFKPNTLNSEYSIAEGRSETEVEIWGDSSFPMSLETPRKQAELFVWDGEYKEAIRTLALGVMDNIAQQSINQKKTSICV